MSWRDQSYPRALPLRRPAAGERRPGRSSAVSSWPTTTRPILVQRDRSLERLLEPIRRASSPPSLAGRASSGSSMQAEQRDATSGSTAKPPRLLTVMGEGQGCVHQPRGRFTWAAPDFSTLELGCASRTRATTRARSTSTTSSSRRRAWAARPRLELRAAVPRTSRPLLRGDPEAGQLEDADPRLAQDCRAGGPACGRPPASAPSASSQIAGARHSPHLVLGRRRGGSQDRARSPDEVTRVHGDQGSSCPCPPPAGRRSAPSPSSTRAGLVRLPGSSPAEAAPLYGRGLLFEIPQVADRRPQKYLGSSKDSGR